MTTWHLARIHRTCARRRRSRADRPPCLSACAFQRAAPRALPPCIWQRPLRIAGAAQGHPLRVRAPHRGALFSAKAFPIISMTYSRCMGLFVANRTKRAADSCRNSGVRRWRKRERKWNFGGATAKPHGNGAKRCGGSGQSQSTAPGCAQMSRRHSAGNNVLRGPVHIISLLPDYRRRHHDAKKEGGG
jgi:hypothetical protein